MRIQLVLIIAFVAPITSHALPFEDICEKNLDKGSIQVKVLPYRVTTDFTKSVSEITTIANRDDYTNSRLSDRIVGLLSSKRSVRLSYESSYIERKGQECARPSYIMEVGFTTPVLYVAKEIRPGTCGFNEVYQHELKHMYISQNFLANVSDRINSRVNREVGLGILYNNVHYASKINQEKVVKIAREEMLTIDAENNSLDSPAEYDRVVRSCNGEIIKVLQAIQ